MRMEKLAEELNKRFGLSGSTVETIPEHDRVIVVRPDALRDALRYLMKQDHWHLTTITADIWEGHKILYYHFWLDAGITLKIAQDPQAPDLDSISDLLPGAMYYEKEISELFNVTFKGLPQSGPLLLPEDWDECGPMGEETDIPQPESLKAEEFVDGELTPERMVVPIGPQHPLLKEPLSVKLLMRGEEVEGSMLRLGYVHRGIEKLAQDRSYVQNVHLVERICGICSHVHTTTYCQAVESLSGIQVPLRGLVIRMLMCELERIHSHLLWLGVLAKNIGFETIFMYAWRDRELILDMMERVSGGRVSHAVNQIGGVRNDITDEMTDEMAKGLREMTKRAEELLRFVDRDKSFSIRTRGIARLSLDDIKNYCVVGPVARASGLDRDIRRDLPNAAYEQLNVNVIVMNEGDVWARSMVRLLETVESVRLCRQMLDAMPSGPVRTDAPRHIPAGTAITRSEAPRGEVLYYLRSDGSQNPARIKIRTPSLTNLITLPLQLESLNMADVSVAISGIDLCIACADR